MSEEREGERNKKEREEEGERRKKKGKEDNEKKKREREKKGAKSVVNTFFFSNFPKKTPIFILTAIKNE